MFMNKLGIKENLLKAQKANIKNLYYMYESQNENF